jgi:hypothetical protein
LQAQILVESDAANHQSSGQQMDERLFNYQTTLNEDTWHQKPLRAWTTPRQVINEQINRCNPDQQTAGNPWEGNS